MQIDIPKPFIIPVFSLLAPSSLVLGEHSVMKDLFLYEVACLLDSGIPNSSRGTGKKTLGENIEASFDCYLAILQFHYPSSSSAIRHPTQKKKNYVDRPV